MSTIENFAEQFGTSAVPQAVLDVSIGCVSLAVNPSHAAHFESEEPVRTKQDLIRRVLDQAEKRALSCHCEEIHAVDVLELDQCVFLQMHKRALLAETPVRDLEFRIINQNGGRQYDVYCADAQLLPERSGALAVALQPAPEYRICVETIVAERQVWRVRAELRNRSKLLNSVPSVSVVEADAPSYFSFMRNVQRAKDLVRSHNMPEALRVLADLEEAYQADYPKRTLIARLRFTDPHRLEHELDQIWERLFDYYALERVVFGDLRKCILEEVPSPPAYRAPENFSVFRVSPSVEESGNPLFPTLLDTKSIGAQQAHDLLTHEPYLNIIDTITRVGSLRSAEIDGHLRIPGVRAAVDELLNCGLLAYEEDQYLVTPYAAALMSMGSTALSRKLDLDDLNASINSLHTEELIEILKGLQLPQPTDINTDRRLRQYLRQLAQQWAQTNESALGRLNTLLADIEIRELNR